MRISVRVKSKSMKVSVSVKNAIVYSISLIYALLFVYAAMSKLLDYGNFSRQLGQSPMLSAFAGWIRWFVPLLELIIAVFLFVPKVRLAAMFAAYLLMTMFTVYIYILLNYSSFVPCSCGGILEKLTWNQHMFFNIIFMFLGIVGIILYPLKANPITVEEYENAV